MHMNTIKLITFCIFLTLAATASFAQSLTGKSTEQLKEMQQQAIAIEDYDLAQKIKQQLNRIEQNKAKIKVLEEEKKTALSLEDYDKVMEIDKKIEALKNGEELKPFPKKEIATQPNPATTISTTPTVGNVANNATPAPYNDLKSDLSKKNIGAYGFGLGKFGFSAAADFIVFNKYLRGGIEYDLGGNLDDDLIAFDFRFDVKAIVDLNAGFVPYSGVGLGINLNADDEFGMGPSFAYKVGSYLFFSRNKGFGVFYELNINLTNSDLFPFNRIGIAFTSLKRKHR